MHNKSAIPSAYSLPPPSALFAEWPLRPDVVHLDHGSAGGCPRRVMADQQDIAGKIEQGPHEWFAKEYAFRIKAAKVALADFLNADVTGLALLPGTTHGLNVACLSHSFQHGDELLTTDHAYSSTTKILEHVAQKYGARVVVARVPFPVESPDQLLDSIMSYVSAKTKFAVIDHIPSRTGLVFPIRRIVAELNTRGIDTLVDGAHAPGHVQVDLRSIDASYYVASCHKWMCTPRGVGFIYVRKDKLPTVSPVIIARSCYYRDNNPSLRTRLEHDFDWMGTYDPSAYLSLPSTIAFLESICPNGHAGLVRRNHNLALQARRIISRELGIPAACPDDMVGSMVAVPLPDSVGPEYPQGTLPLQKRLFEEARIEVQVYNFPQYPKRLLRFSIQAHNSFEQIEYLAHHLKVALAEEK
ncbi:hypothetical protein CNMCM8927_000881 [Aspergillus lentulus]|uniref:Aminotransferase class V domain-containing protein n=1 Tax=Aspergillus lentulus TaxID=293939 RepID=A0AAN5YIZ6_ASPLE|nr:hypothetical protein CNMCM8927_000881 [Aspergillus lentulus]